MSTVFSRPQRSKPQVVTYSLKMDPETDTKRQEDMDKSENDHNYRTIC